MFLKNEKNWCRMCNNLIDGKKSHRCEDSFICKLCDLQCSDAHSLEKHLYIHCAQIPIKIKKAKGSNSEMSSSVGRKRYACSICKIVLTNGATIRTHKCQKLDKVTEGTPSNKLRVCCYCSKTFSNAVTLLKHLRLHSEKLTYICRFCDKVCSCKSHLDMHERVHTGEKPYVCGKGFAQQNQWTTHMTHHTGRTFKCDKCDKTYGRTADLKIHIRTTHLGQKREKKYLCTVCGHASESTSKLKLHMSDFCEKMFKDNSTLMKHKMVHYGEKPHKCPVCPYRCKLKFNLKQHAKKHANEAARLAAKQCDAVYLCDDCNKPFTTQELLLDHIRSTQAKIVN